MWISCWHTQSVEIKREDLLNERPVALDLIFMTVLSTAPRLTLSFVLVGLLYALLEVFQTIQFSLITFGRKAFLQSKSNLSYLLDFSPSVLVKSCLFCNSSWSF